MVYTIQYGNRLISIQEICYNATVKVILYFQAHAVATVNPDKLAGAVEMAERFNLRIQRIDDPMTADSVKRLISFWDPIGAIVECGSRTETVNPKIFGNLPVVFFNAPFDKQRDNVFYVKHDSKKTGLTAARILLETGYDTFAFIHPFSRLPWSDERMKSFSEALKLNSRPCREFAFPEGSTAERHNSLGKFLLSLPHPAAVFAANDHVGEMVISCCSRTGLNVPEDVAVLGVDNVTSVCEHTKPTLSSIAPDFRRGGNLAVMMLIAAQRGKGRFIGSHNRHFGISKIVRRASTTQLQKHDPLVAASLEFIRREACNGIKASQVAKLFDCSRRMADIRFSRAVGRSILSEIQRVRLERAKELLSNPRQVIKSIHDFCGFATANALSKFFRQETGMTPSAWRKSSGRHPGTDDGDGI